MRNIIAFIFLFATLVCFAQQQEPTDQAERSVFVAGTAKMEIPADQASFSFSVSAYGSSLRLSVATAQLKISRVIEKLKEAGLKNENFETSSFYSGENQGGKAFLSSSKDFTARVSVKVTTSDLAKLDEFLFVTSECQIDDLSKVEFKLKDVVSFRKKLRSEALLIAKQKAIDAVEVLGAKLGKVLSVELDRRDRPQPYNNVMLNSGITMMDEASNFEYPKALYRPNFEFIETVYVKFAIE